MIWVYGEPKIGKTTFASQFPGCWFLATERGHDYIEMREPTTIASWPDFLDFCASIQDIKPKTFGDGTPIQTLVIDTIENLYKMCQDAVCENLGVENPGDLDHGKGWARLSQEFERVMGKIRRWPWTLVCISHARQKDFKTRGRTVNKYEPNIGAGGYRWCQSAADLIVFAHSTEIVTRNDAGEVTGEITEKRVLLCQPKSWAVAGGRMSDRLPDMVDLSYDVLLSNLLPTSQR